MRDCGIEGISARSSNYAMVVACVAHFLTGLPARHRSIRSKLRPWPQRKILTVEDIRRASCYLIDLPLSEQKTVNDLSELTRNRIHGVVLLTAKRIKGPLR